MSKSISFMERTGVTQSHLKQLRKQGHIPAVFYGKGMGSISVEVKEKEIIEVLRRNPRAILQATIPGHGIKPVLIQDIQREALSGKLLHIDFHHVNMTESMDSKVAIHYSGEPAGVKAGGILQVELHEVEVRCMPDKLLAAFEVDISGLGIGDQLHVSDLSVHDGIKVLSDPSATIVKIWTNQTANETAEDKTE